MSSFLEKIVLPESTGAIVTTPAPDPVDVIELDHAGEKKKWLQWMLMFKGGRNHQAGFVVLCSLAAPAFKRLNVPSTLVAIQGKQINGSLSTPVMALAAHTHPDHLTVSADSSFNKAMDKIEATSNAPIFIKDFDNGDRQKKTKFIGDLMAYSESRLFLVSSVDKFNNNRDLNVVSVKLPEVDIKLARKYARIIKYSNLHYGTIRQELNQIIDSNFEDIEKLARRKTVNMMYNNNIFMNHQPAAPLIGATWAVGTKCHGKVIRFSTYEVLRRIINQLKGE